MPQDRLTTNSRVEDLKRLNAAMSLKSLKDIYIPLTTLIMHRRHAAICYRGSENDEEKEQLLKIIEWHNSQIKLLLGL